MRILLAEDDVRLGKIVAHMLSKEAYQVDYVQNGRDVLDYSELVSYDVMILDWMMPEISGVEAISILRKEGYQGGIIMLTAKDDMDDIITGLDQGADDYIVKPFKIDELLARIRAVARRKEKQFDQELVIGDFNLNLESCMLYRGDKAIELTKKEFQLLEYFFQNKGRVLTREQIINHVWGYDCDVTDNALDALIRLVRKKIDEHNKPSVIQNIRGIGYRMGHDDV